MATTVQETASSFKPSVPARDEGTGLAARRSGATTTAAVAQQQLDQASKFPTVVEIFAQPLVRKSLPGIVLMLLIVLFGGLYFWVDEGEFRSLYPELSDGDRSAAYEVLTAADMPVRLNEQTGSMEIPVDLYHEARMLLAAEGRGLYFSRSALPHVRDVDPADWCAHTSFWGHVGIYAYRADVLQRWPQLPISPLEDLEKLEQLRLIEAGIRIDTLEVDEDQFSVDTPEQLEQARAIASMMPPG